MVMHQHGLHSHSNERGDHNPNQNVRILMIVEDKVRITNEGTFSHPENYKMCYQYAREYNPIIYHQLREINLHFHTNAKLIGQMFSK